MDVFWGDCLYALQVRKELKHFLRGWLILEKSVGEVVLFDALVDALSHSELAPVFIVELFGVECYQ